MLTLLYYHVPGTAVHYPLRGLNEIDFFGELARFAVIQHDEIDLLQQLQEIGTTALNPEVHGITRHELRAINLLKNIQLKSRVDVAKKNERCVSELCRNLGTEARKNSKMSLQSLGGIEIMTVSPAPPE
jgi:hypothetical protein